MTSENRKGRGFMRNRKISLSVYLEPEMNDRLRRLCESTKVPAAEYVRAGIAYILGRAESTGLLETKEAP